MITKNKIMVIDDDSILLKSIEVILSKENYQVIIAHSGNEALTFINNGIIPDLILLDVAMPDMDGYSTFTAIKAILNVPIIFLSGMEDNNSELTGLKLGAVDYVTKPFIPDILLARINIHLKDNTNNTIQSIQTTNIYGDTSELIVTLNKEKCEHMKTVLTESEYRVGKRIALGYTNQEIADELNFSYSYVKKIANRIFIKLGINKRYEIRTYFTK